VAHRGAGKFNAEGYLTRSAIVRAEDKQAWAALDAAGAAATNAPNYHAQMLTRGQLMFRGQCLACHTVDGYRSMRDFLATRDHKGIANILTMLHEHKPDSAYSVFMPPLVGTSNEIAALNLYLDTLAAPQK